MASLLFGYFFLFYFFLRFSRLSQPSNGYFSLSFFFRSPFAVNKTLRPIFFPRFSFEFVMQLLEWKVLMLFVCFCLFFFPFFSSSSASCCVYNIYFTFLYLTFNRIDLTFNPYLITLSSSRFKIFFANFFLLSNYSFIDLLQLLSNENWY